MPQGALQPMTPSILPSVQGKNSPKKPLMGKKWSKLRESNRGGIEGMDQHVIDVMFTVWESTVSALKFVNESLKCHSKSTNEVGH